MRKKYLKPLSPYAKIKLIEEKILKNLGKKLKYNTFRLGTIAGVSKGIRFHTAVNNFCLSVALGESIKVYKTALHQFRPYLSLGDVFKLFKFTIEKNFFENDIYNVVSNNYTVYEIIKKIRKYRKNIKISNVYSPIMNHLSYHMSKKKLSADFIGRGGSWLDTGNIKDFYSASSFISTIEERQGLKIACLEEIALNQNFISKSWISFCIPCKYNEINDSFNHLRSNR